MHDCTSEEVLKNDLERCKLHGVQRIKLPEVGEKKRRNKVKFTKTEYQLRLPFAIYADFESALCKQDSCQPFPSKSFTTHYQHYVSCRSCINVKCSDGQSFETPQVNMTDDAAENCLDQVLATTTVCRQHLVNKTLMKQLTREQRREYKNTAAPRTAKSVPKHSSQ